VRAAPAFALFLIDFPSRSGYDEHLVKALGVEDYLPFPKSVSKAIPEMGWAVDATAAGGVGQWFAGNQPTVLCSASRPLRFHRFSRDPQLHLTPLSSAAHFNEAWMNRTIHLMRGAFGLVACASGT
jgi:hypothetical protein